MGWHHRPTIDPTTRHTRFAPSMASFSPDGRRVVTAGDVEATHVWNVESGREAYPPLRHRFYSSGPARFSPRGDRRGRPVPSNARIWSAEAGRAETPTIELDALPASVSFSPDGQLVVTSDAGGRIRIWRTDTGAAAGPPLRHAGIVFLSAFDSTGRWLLTAGEDGSVRVWDLATTAPAYPEEEKGFSQFASNGRVVTVRNRRESLLRVWDSTSGDPVTPPLRLPDWAGHAVTADGRIAVGVSGNEARLWDTSSGEPVGAPLRHPARVQRGVSVAFSPDGLTLGLNSQGMGAERLGPDAVSLWDVGSHALRATLAFDQRVNALSFTPDSRSIVTGSNDQTVRVWDARTGSPSGAPLNHDAAVWALAVSPDGASLATQTVDSRLSVWTLTAGALLWPVQRVRGDEMVVSFSPDGQSLATAGNSDVQVWKLATGARLGPPMLTGGLTHVLRFSPDSRWLLAGGVSATARVWCAETGEPVTPRYKQAGPVEDAGFSPDGRQVVTTRVHDFYPDKRPVSDLKRIADLLSGRRLASDTITTPLSSDELRREWTALATTYRGTFEASPIQVQAWHREKALSLAADGAWEQAVAHLDQAIAAGPQRWRLMIARGRARAELGRWDGAAVDHGAALEMIPGELEPAFALALLHSMRGERSPLEDQRRRLLEHWGQTQNPDRARWAAQAMVLAPIDSDAGRSQTLTWAKTALESSPAIRNV